MTDPTTYTAAQMQDAQRLIAAVARLPPDRHDEFMDAVEALILTAQQAQQRSSAAGPR